jgi:DNA polymerase-3 subunit epsilon
VRTVIVFDVETTGTDLERDQVIELCVQYGLEAGSPSQTWRIRPDIPIKPGALAVHGISDAELIGCASFEAYADEIRTIFKRSRVLVGYHLTFDIGMLQAEFARIGQHPLDLVDKTVVDAYRVWKEHEPRSLQNAHQRFVGDRFEHAHSASADVAATGRVLRGMIDRFGLDDIARVTNTMRGRHDE